MFYLIVPPVGTTIYFKPGKPLASISFGKGFRNTDMSSCHILEQSPATNVQGWIL